jgi:hypothetical protein
MGYDTDVFGEALRASRDPLVRGKSFGIACVDGVYFESAESYRDSLIRNGNYERWERLVERNPDLGHLLAERLRKRLKPKKQRATVTRRLPPGVIDYQI